MNDSRIETKLTNQDDKRFSAKRYTIVGAITVAVLVGGIGKWFTTAEIAGAVIASGSVKVAQNRQIVQHPYGGIIKDILISEGAHVNEDAVLLRLEDSEFITELQIVENQLGELLARKSRLEAERDQQHEMIYSTELQELQNTSARRAELIAGQKRLFETRRENLNARRTQISERISQVRVLIEGLEAQHVSIIDQLALVREELINQQALLKQGLTQAPRVLALRRTEAALRGSEGQLIADVTHAQGQITELEMEIINLQRRQVEEASSILREIDVQIFQLFERREQLKNRLSQLEIRAPVSGIVYGLSVFARKAVIGAADPLLYLIPQDQALTIDVRIAPADIEQIFTNQPVHLKFSSFRQSASQDLVGQVLTISADAFTDERTNIQYYLVNIGINEGERDKLPEGTNLIPGMPVDAFIETTARTPLEYFIQPFRASIQRAFRES